MMPLPGLRFYAAYSTQKAVCVQGQRYGNVPLSYDAIASRRHRKGRPSNLPSSRETEALLSMEKRDLFTDDAWQGMLK